MPARNNEKYAGVLAYSYSISGDVFHGEYKRSLASEEAAREFLRGLEGQTVSVQYNPTKPSRSVLLEDTVEVLLRNRPPAPDARHWSDSLPPLLKPFLGLFALLSFVGLVLSIWVHVGALFGRQVAPDYFFWGLHIGIFVVFFPAVMVAQKRVGTTSRRDFWKVVTKGSPEGLRYLLYFFFAYALVNFAIFWFQTAAMGRQVGPPSSLTWRGFSGHWMVFYCASLAILTSALRSSSIRDGLPSIASSPDARSLRVLTFPPPFRRRPIFAPFLRTNLISTLLPKACATRINVPIVRFRGSFSIAEIFGALISALAANFVWLRFSAGCRFNLRLSTLPLLYLYSEVAMLAIRLPESIEKRLEKLARRTGRTKTFYVREAILEHLDDLEDLYLAEKSFDRIQKGDEQTVPLEELLK